MKNRKNNKGFSLVELIVVVAIMAVLVGVLAPAYLNYVEKSRYQKDVSAIGEVCSAVQTAIADEDCYDEVTTTLKTVATIDENGVAYNATAADDVDSIVAAVKQVIAEGSAKLTSKTFGTTDVTVKVQYDNTNKVVKIYVGNFIKTVNGTAEATDVVYPTGF